MSVRVRFAPSPTGPLHIGGARSALFNWLFARHHGGQFIVRIEDTDMERSSRQSEENILAALRWLGIDWDEGIDVGGNNGPYRQTERLDIYRRVAQQLLEQGLAYHCYCSEEKLAADRERLMAKGELPRYLGHCRHLSPEEKAKFEAEGRKPTLRFKVPENRVIAVDDRVRGRVEFESDGIGDFIIMKSDRIPTYNFAVVVDDHDMKISHVIRAEEHLSNTPRQIMLYDALKWEKPTFAHVSLILGKDRSKMSKRHGATSIEQYKSSGYLPEAMVNFLALMGWSPGGEEEVFAVSELQKLFSLDKVSKSPAVFDLDKLNWLNGYYIRNSDLDYITDLAVPYLQRAGYIAEDAGPEDVALARQMVKATRKYLTNLSEVTEHVGIFYDDAVKPVDDKARQVLAQEEVPQVMRLMKQKVYAAGQLEEDVVKGMLKELTKELGFGGKKVYMPLRVALTGKLQGPELYEIIPILGVRRTVARLDAVLDGSILN
ncbi:glutamate--tRNA ligase [Desulfofalx alkaliphila]|uniref:glutamate--tRNA ligase n=1 Tax=Desulfofalx alkaliphila TaxID=105483 RepID=UPI0004E0B6CA|nr:glutamate--tRNA ligase [Desulfofalx alkaliphila]